MRCNFWTSLDGRTYSRLLQFMKACTKRLVLLWLIYFLTLPINIAYTDNINLIPPSEKTGAPNGSFSE